MKTVPARIIPATVIHTCYDCPFLKYDSRYGMSFDSGFDCEKTGDRIADDGWVKHFNDETHKWNESQKTLFPMTEEEKPFNPFTIPDNCPLEELTEEACAE